MLFSVFSIYWKVLDCLFPPRCAGCQEWGVRFCPRCLNNLKFIPDPLCTRCGDVLTSNRRSFCKRCSEISPQFNQVRSCVFYQGDIRNAIRKLKYLGDLGLGECLADLLLELANQQTWNIDLVTCVPLDNQRKKDRGYNQAEYLGRPLAHKMGKPFFSNAISRIKYTQPQVGLSIADRIQNVDHAFSSEEFIVSGKSILIIDDVITTGATLNSCAAALLKGNAKNVYGITLARAERLLEE